jgi:hypothetical protein
MSSHNSPWIRHLRAYCAKHKVTWKEAMVRAAPSYRAAQRPRYRASLKYMCTNPGHPDPNQSCSQVRVYETRDQCTPSCAVIRAEPQRQKRRVVVHDDSEDSDEEQPPTPRPRPRRDPKTPPTQPRAQPRRQESLCGKQPAATANEILSLGKADRGVWYINRALKNDKFKDSTGKPWSSSDYMVIARCLMDNGVRVRIESNKVAPGSIAKIQNAARAKNAPPPELFNYQEGSGGSSGRGGTSSGRQVVQELD